MNPEKKISALLWDMIQFGNNTIGLVKDAHYEQFASTKLMQWAVERQLELFGEAARRISSDFRDNNKNIPWDKIIGLRNILAHEYGEIKVEMLWTNATIRIPAHIEPLEKLLERQKQKE